MGLSSFKFSWWAPKDYVFWNTVRNGPSRSFKVVDFGTNRKRVCDFLLVINSNLGPMLPCFRDIAGFLRTAIFPYSRGGSRQASTVLRKTVRNEEKTIFCINCTRLVKLYTKFLLNNNHLGISMTVFEMFDFGRGPALDPAGGAYSAPTDPIVGFKGPTSDWIEACLLLKNVFLHSACCNILNVFSLGQTDGHRYDDSPLPKTSSWMENCTKFSQLILSKITKIVATSCQISRLKCTKFDFGWGFAPDPAGGAYSAPPDPLAGLRGPTSRGRDWGRVLQGIAVSLHQHFLATLGFTAVR